MRRDVMFLGMDIVNSTKEIFDKYKDEIMGDIDDEKKIFFLKGANSMLSILEDTLNRERLIDGEETFFVHVEELKDEYGNYNYAKEFLKSDLFKLADKRGYDLPEIATKP